MQRTVVLELNELVPELLDELIDAGQLPHFGRLRARSEVFVTDASNEIHLEPWVQWPTLHTGIADRDHGIERLGEADRVRGKGVARELASAGFKVGIFGSMNVDYGPLDGFTVPDPWNPSGRAHPADLQPFVDFVSTAVQESSSATIDRRQVPRFVAFLVSHGVRPATAARVVRQLVDERRDRGTAWRRATVLDALAFDVFTTLVHRHEVAFATFFSNSTAHFQHYFWRNFRPDEFTLAPPETDHESLSAAVVTGYRRMDDLVGQALARFEGDRLVFATALSQQPWDTSKCTYRPHDMREIVDLAGIDRSSVDIEPLMAEEFSVSFPDAARAADGAVKLAGLSTQRGPLLRQEQDGRRLKLGCAVNEWSPGELTVRGPGADPRPFGDLFVRIHGLRSGRHHPHGCFWVTSPTPGRHEGTVSLTAIAPTLLQLYGVEAPAYMKDLPLDIGG
jgi:hypothetical protein